MWGYVFDGVAPVDRASCRIYLHLCIVGTTNCWLYPLTDEICHMQCDAVTSAINKCIAFWTGTSQVTLELISNYALQIYQFLQSGIDLSLLQFLQVVEKRVDPRVKVATLNCGCTEPSSSVLPWICNTTENGAGSSPICECRGDADDVLCKFQVSCPDNYIAVGGNFENQIDYDTEFFSFDAIGFGVPGLVTGVVGPVPLSTRCVAKVSRSSDQDFNLTASAYCKAL